MCLADRPRLRPRHASTLLLTSLLSVLAGAAERAAPGEALERAYLEELEARALELGLDRDPRWRALVHYESRWPLPGVRSDASLDAFYLAPQGRSDPRGELAATLAALLEPEAVREGEPLQCRFAARFRFLDERLRFDPRRLPRRTCAAYDAWREGIGGAAVSLIFPEAFMNSPASMFGHTLLRLDATPEESPRNLAAYAVDFTADTRGEAGPLYLLKGLLGRYAGYFSVSPYYAKTWLYADWQNRDIWEYRLQLEREEVDLLLLHLWELRTVSFPYWFLDENCSYRLLRLLEAARPGLELTQEFGPLVLPVDTVRAVVEQPGLVARVHYRPSPVSEIRSRLDGLSDDARAWARDLGLAVAEPTDATGKGLEARERAAALSIAYDYLRYRFLAEEIGEEASRALAQRILLARSRLGPAPGGAPLFAPVPEPTVRPERGHRTSRGTLAGGFRNGEGFLEARLRWAVHDLMDPEGGYPRGSQVDFLDARLRWFPGPGKLRLEDAALLDVRSLAPRDDFFAPVSWRFDVGLRTRLLDAAGRGLGKPRSVGRLAGGLGLDYDLARWLSVYGFAEATLDGGPALEHDVAFGPGAVAGLYLRTPGDRWKGHLFARVRGYVLGDSTTALTLGSEQRVTIHDRLALQLDLAWQRDFGHSWLEGALAWHVYF